MRDGAQSYKSVNYWVLIGGILGFLLGAVLGFIILIIAVFFITKMASGPAWLEEFPVYLMYGLAAGTVIGIPSGGIIGGLVGIIIGRRVGKFFS